MVTLPFREASESVLPLGRLSQESPVSSGATDARRRLRRFPGKEGSAGWTQQSQRNREHQQERGCLSCQSDGHASKDRPWFPAVKWETAKRWVGQSGAGLALGDRSARAEAGPVLTNSFALSGSFEHRAKWSSVPAQVSSTPWIISPIACAHRRLSRIQLQAAEVRKIRGASNWAFDEGIRCL